MLHNIVETMLNNIVETMLNNAAHMHKNNPRLATQDNATQDNF